MPDAAIPNHPNHRTLLIVPNTMRTGATNGLRRTGSGRGAERGPSHQVDSPSWTLAFQTAASAIVTPIQANAIVTRQPSDNSPARGGRVAGIDVVGSAGRAVVTDGEVGGEVGNDWPGSPGVVGSGTLTTLGASPGPTTPQGSTWSTPTGPLPSPDMADMAGATDDVEASETFEKLSVFYPMWNEEDYIERALTFGRRACVNLQSTGDIIDYELIVIDDKSTDRTGEIADRLAAADPHIRVIHHERNRKLGGSMKTGFQAATGDLVLYTDADLPFDMAELPRAVRLLREYGVDIISAYRFDRTGEGSLRAVYTSVYNALIKALFGVKVRDINFAFKLCRRRIFDDIELRSEGSFIDAELIIRSTRLGYEIMQMGVDYFPRTRGQSTLSSPGVIVTILKEMWSLRKDLESIEKVR